MESSETLPECLSQLNLGQDQTWAMSGQKLGHKVKSMRNNVNYLEGTILIQFIALANCFYIILKSHRLPVTNRVSAIAHKLLKQI